MPLLTINTHTYSLCCCGGLSCLEKQNKSPNMDAAGMKSTRRPLVALLFILSVFQILIHSIFNRQSVKYLHLNNNHHDAMSIMPPTPPGKEEGIRTVTSTRPYYYELEEEIRNLSSKIKHNSDTAYNFATIVEGKRQKEKSTNTSSWFEPRKVCRKKCCANKVAISLDQDSTQIINTMDGLDLADVVIRNNQGYKHLKIHANNFHSHMIPCLQPGTIFHLNSHSKIVKYFWRKVRPKIKVPFLLITSDADSSSKYPGYSVRSGGGFDAEDDTLMIKWYGQNPKLDDDGATSGHYTKFEPFSLGLSMNHPQSKYLSPYLSLTNYSNPYADKNFKNRFKNWKLNWNEDVVISFGRKRPHRQQFWDMLCPNTTESTPNGISCNPGLFNPSEIYASASKFKFGMSPPGAGWDCYRTYEWLLLGIIPVVEERVPESRRLFQNLPVVQMPNMTSENNTIADFQTAIEDYIHSSEFQDANFELGWQKLFLQYWRRKILKDANREIVYDEEGKEYYTAWQYTSTSTKTDKQT